MIFDVLGGLGILNNPEPVKEPVKIPEKPKSVTIKKSVALSRKSVKKTKK